MKKVTQAAEGQNIIDLAIKLTGSVEGIFDVIDSTDGLQSVDDVLVPGQEVSVEESKVVKPEITNYLVQRGIRINTGQGQSQT